VKAKRKICVLSCNRSEYSRIKTVLLRLRETPEVELQIIALRTPYSNNRVLLERDGFHINEEIKLNIDERKLVNIPKAIGELTTSFGQAYARLQPDIVVVLGDRYEALAAVTAATYMNLFIAHIQGGEVTGTTDEHTRHAITKLSHLHFPATALAAERVIKLGEKPEMVHNVGCPGTDLLLAAPVLSFSELRHQVYQATNQRREILECFRPDYILLLQFPVVTEVHQTADSIQKTLEALQSFDKLKVVLTPNPDAGSDEIEQALRRYAADNCGSVLLLKHLPAELFFNLMRHAAVMVGNSSAAIRETGYLGLPVVNIGSRQAGRERSANIVDAPEQLEAIKQITSQQLSHGPYPIEQVYGDGHAAEKIVASLLAVDYSQIQKRLAY
jgi:UDP-hydrolysing UDP-N-acetyl-D-glucosamine 2-epimerase